MLLRIYIYIYIYAREMSLSGEEIYLKILILPCGFEKQIFSIIFKLFKSKTRNR